MEHMQYTPAEYYEMLAKMNNDEISLDAWADYCTHYLAILLEENKDVLIRLKNR